MSFPPSHPRVALLTVSDALIDWESTMTDAVWAVLPRGEADAAAEVVTDEA
ncbi:hypothetical protein [Streptomyces sp. NPDC055189]